jgi:hypothetical protein
LEVGKKGHQKKIALAVVAIVVIVVGAWLVLAYPSTVVQDSNRAVTGLSSSSYPFTVGFPKSAIRVSFTVQGSGIYLIQILNSSGNVIWSEGGAASGTTTTTVWDWMAASGTYTLTVGWLAAMTYSITVTAKGAPW